MKSREEREALLRHYIELDHRRNEAKGNKWYNAHPLDGDCITAWQDCIAAFDGNNSAASDMLYQIRGNRPTTEYVPPAPPQRRVAEATTAARAVLPPGTPASTVERPLAPPAPRRGGSVVRDPRIPPPGTVIYKRDRHGAVLAEATVREDGIEYAGQIYKSPSAAGLAASIATGGAKTAIDGYTFWGLNPPKVK